jgi:C-terminal processing protease CtpA/Prc
MRKSLVAAVFLTAVSTFAFAQTGTSGAIRPGSQSVGDPHEKQTTPIDISKQSGTASGERGDTGTRGSDSDSSITGRTRSPDIAYGSPAAKKAKPAKKHKKIVKHRVIKHAAPAAH